jgi:F-type H+-transporting ATPase subunit b
MMVVPAFAAEEGGHGGDEGINPFAGNLGNLIWTWVIFILVVVVLGKYAWGPLLTALQKREKFIRDSLETAKHEREASEARLAEYEQKLRAAHDQAVEIVEEARRDAEIVRRRVEEEARQSSAEILERAKREIGVARDSAMRDLYNTSAELAVNMASTVLQREVTAEDQDKLVQDALAQLKERDGNLN